MAYFIDLSIDGVLSKDLHEYLKNDNSLLSENVDIFIPRDRGDTSNSTVVTAALISASVGILCTIITSLTNIYIAQMSKSSVIPVEKNNVVVIIEGDKDSTEFELPEAGKILEEKFQLELEKIDSVRSISIRSK